MKVFIDLISGDEMVSDSYPHTYIMNDAILEVKGRYVKKGNTQVMIASDDVIEEDENAETVVDIVDSFGFNELKDFPKKDFMVYIKGFLAAVSAKLEAKGKADRIPEFKKGATEAVKLIVARYDEFQIYTGKDYNMEAGFAFSYQKEQEDAGPTFMFFADCGRWEKF
jgi:hypothetical protein